MIAFLQLTSAIDTISYVRYSIYAGAIFARCAFLIICTAEYPIRRILDTCIIETFWLADYLSRKRDLPYSVTMGWLRCCLNFAMLRSAILCIRGSRSSKRHQYHEANINLTLEEGRLDLDSE